MCDTGMFSFALYREKHSTTTQSICDPEIKKKLNLFQIGAVDFFSVPMTDYPVVI
jgi:hypothetical protein